MEMKTEDQKAYEARVARWEKAMDEYEKLLSEWKTENTAEVRK